MEKMSDIFYLKESYRTKIGLENKRQQLISRITRTFKLLILLTGFIFINSTLTQAQTLQELDNKAFEYYKQGNYSNAIVFAEKSLKQAEKEFGKKHPDYAVSLNNLAFLYKSDGDYTTSESLYVKALEINKNILGENHPDYATCLNNLAGLYFSMAYYTKAEPLYIEAMEIRKKNLGENDPEYALSLNHLALLYHHMGDYKKAEPLYLDALEIRKKILGENNIDYAESLNNLAGLYNNMGDYSKAEPLYTKGMEINKKAFGETHPAYATALNNLAALYDNMGNYSKAETLYLQAMEIRKKSLGELHPDYATSLNNIAFLYAKKGIYVKAEALYIQAIEISKKALGELHPDYATSLNNLAVLYDDMGEFAKAESLDIQAIEITKKAYGETHPSYAKSINNLATLYVHLGDYLKAEPLLLQACEIWKVSLGEYHPDYAKSLNNLSVLYDKMGDYTKAEPFYLKALEIAKKTLGETHSDYALSLNNLALYYNSLGQYSKAELLFFKSLEIYKNTIGENHPTYATVLNNLAMLYGNIGNYKKAEELYFQSMAIRKKILGETHPDYASSLSNLATSYIDLGDYLKAEPLLLQACEIRKVSLGEYHPDYASFLNNLGGLYIAMGDYSKAEAFYLQALEIRKESFGKNHPDYALSLNNLGSLYLKLTNFAKAEPLFIHAIVIQKKALGETNSSYATYLYSLALLYEYKNDFKKAKPLFLQSLEISIQNIKQQFSFLSEKEKALYFKTLSGRFEDLNSISLKRKESNPSITVDVYNNQLKTKGILLKSSTAMRNAVLGSNDERLIVSYDKWNSLKKQIATIYNLPIEKRTTDLPKLENEANDLEKELTRSTTTISEFNSLFELNWKDIQTQLKQNEAAIEFTNFNYNKDSVLYCALLIKKESEFPEMIQLFEEKQLADLLSGLKENNSYAIASVYGSKRYTETKLYDVIWKPLEQYLKGIEIINYSPSGLLHKVSFAALSNADDHYLIDDYKLNMLTTTAMVVKPLQPIIDKNMEVSLFGGINYSINDTTQKPWNYLKGTLSETKQLNDTLKNEGIKVNYIKANNATKQTFQSVAANSNILHVATHGFFFPEPKIIKTEADQDKTNMDIVSRSASRAVELNYIRNDNPLMRSGLVFAGVNDYWNGITDDIDNNGILTALEVVNIDLRKNKLAVLSACETGLGDIKDGEGVYGLQRAFKMAGAENIIMSLWSVPDKETSEFMQTFYSLLFKEQNINQAFTETQKLMRKKYDPYYWAAFVLVR